MNKAILMGRLTRDPEIRYSSGEKSMAIARYTLEVDRGFKCGGDSTEQTADFIPCIAFDKAGEFAEKYFRQGMRVLISGRIQTGSYTNKEGQKVYTTEIIIDTQEFADSKGESDNSGRYQGSSSKSKSSVSSDGFMNIPDGVDDEGLPFN
nr:MAG TPA: Single strand binding protein [Caudoviricetes sp.]